MGAAVGGTVVRSSRSRAPRRFLSRATPRTWASWRSGWTSAGHIRGVRSTGYVRRLRQLRYVRHLRSVRSRHLGYVRHLRRLRSVRHLIKMSVVRRMGDWRVVRHRRIGNCGLRLFRSGAGLFGRVGRSIGSRGRRVAHSVAHVVRNIAGSVGGLASGVSNFLAGGSHEQAACLSDRRTYRQEALSNRIIAELNPKQPVWCVFEQMDPNLNFEFGARCCER